MTQMALGLSVIPATRSSIEPVPLAPAEARALHRIGALIVDHAAMARPQKAPDDVAAHAAQSDHPELHRLPPSKDRTLAPAADRLVTGRSASGCAG